MSRGGARPRLHRADIVPCLVITGGVVLAVVPFVVALPAAMVVALWLVSTVGRSVAPVHQHCHAHRKIFRRPLVDAAYDLVLLAAAGNTTAVWELQHVHGHHRHYLTRAKDPADNDRFGGGRLRFTILGDAMAWLDAWRIGRGRSRARRRLVRQTIGQLAIVAVAFAVDPGLALAFVVAPWLFLRWAVFWFSWAQHDAVPRRDVYSGSVTHFARTNALYLNVGHHTAHHEQPTLHWTRLPARTARIMERIPTACLR